MEYYYGNLTSSLSIHQISFFRLFVHSPIPYICFPILRSPSASKLINKAVPGTIDERVLNISPQNPDQVIENINLCINSAKAIGCNLGDLTMEHIITGEQSKIVRIVAEIERVGLLHRIGVKMNGDLLYLRGNNEELSDFVKLSSEQLLIRWANYHLRYYSVNLLTLMGSDINSTEY